MSQTSKIVLGIVVVLVVLGGAYYYWHNHAMPSTQSSEAAGATSSEVTTLPTGSSTSDASIQQDLSSIDTQIQGVNSDNASANDSINGAVSAQ